MGFFKKYLVVGVIIAGIYGCYMGYEMAGISGFLAGGLILAGIAAVYNLGIIDAIEEREDGQRRLWLAIYT